jgi:cAMP phosphodiesterase
MLPTSFLINGKIAIDAGAITSGLSFTEQSEINHIFLSHAHIDHLATLPFLLDNLFSSLKTPVTLYGPAHTMKCLKDHLFNDQLWPDFTAFSNRQTSILSMQTVRPGETIEVEGVRLTPAPMDHTVECYGYLVEHGDVSAFISGDTGTIDGALPFIQGASNLRLIVLEASFPNRMQEIASLSKHLTPRDFHEEVKKLPGETRILVTHMKPDCLEEIRQEIEDLGLDHVSLIEQGATYNLGDVLAADGFKSSKYGDHP